MLIKFIDYSSAGEKPPGQQDPVGPEGRVATPNKKFLIVIS